MSWIRGILLLSSIRELLEQFVIEIAVLELLELEESGLKRAQLGSEEIIALLGFQGFLHFLEHLDPPIDACLIFLCFFLQGGQFSLNLSQALLIPVLLRG